MQHFNIINNIARSGDRENEWHEKMKRLSYIVGFVQSKIRAVETREEGNEENQCPTSNTPEAFGGTFKSYIELRIS